MDNHFTNYSLDQHGYWLLQKDFKNTFYIQVNAKKRSSAKKFILKVLLEGIDLKEIIIPTFESAWVESFHAKKIVIARLFARVSLLVLNGFKLKCTQKKRAKYCFVSLFVGKRFCHSGFKQPSLQW